MSKRIAVLGTLDTKGKEVEFLQERIEKMGRAAIVIDIGILNKPLITSDIQRADVLHASGADQQEFEKLIKCNKRADVLEIMVKGASNILQRLYNEEKIDGAVAVGGGTGTSIAARAMQALPIGVPKLLVSSRWSETTIQQEENDVTLMNSTTELLGLNPITRNILNNAAGAITGMTSSCPYKTESKPLIGATCLGTITRSILSIKKILERKNYEIIVCDRQMKILEKLTESKSITGFLDLATNELVLALFLPDFPYHKRLASVYNHDIPLVIAPGGIDFIVLGQRETIPKMFQKRKLYAYMRSVTLVKINKKEMTKLGKIIADIANNAKGPAAIVVPLEGFSSLDKKGQAFYDPIADETFLKALKQNLGKHVQIVEVDAHINDEVFAEKSVEILEHLIETKSRNADND